MSPPLVVVRSTGGDPAAGLLTRLNSDAHRDGDPHWRARGGDIYHASRTDARSAVMAFDLTRLLRALPNQRTRASVDLLLAVSEMKASNMDGFKRALESARRRAGDDDIVSIKFNTLSGRNLTMLTEALSTKKVEFVEALLHEFKVDVSVPVNGKNVIEFALESEGFALFDILIKARLQYCLKPKETLEDFVRAIAPSAASRFAAWESQTAPASRDFIPLGVPVVNRASVSSGTSTLPYEVREETREVVSYAYEPETTTSASVAQSFSPETSGPNAAVNDEDGESRRERGALDCIVHIMQEIPGFELEVMRIEGGDESEADRLHGGALARLLWIENTLSKFMIQLDGLLDGEADRTPELVRRYRKQANAKLASLANSIDNLLAERLATADDPPGSPSVSQ